MYLNRPTSRETVRDLTLDPKKKVFKAYMSVRADRIILLLNTFQKDTVSSHFFYLNVLFFKRKTKHWSVTAIKKE